MNSVQTGTAISEAAFPRLLAEGEKAGLNALVSCYANEMKNGTVRANIVEPGAQRTQMRARAFPGEDPTTLPAPEEMTGVFVDLAEAACTRTGEIVRAYKG